MPADQPVTTGTHRKVRVELGGRPWAANIFDKSVLQMLQDAEDGNGGSLEMLENPAFDKDQRISRPDMSQSVILRLMYQKP